MGVPTPQEGGAVLTDPAPQSGHSVSCRSWDGDLAAGGWEPRRLGGGLRARDTQGGTSQVGERPQATRRRLGVAGAPLGWTTSEGGRTRASRQGTLVPCWWDRTVGRPPRETGQGASEN